MRKQDLWKKKQDKEIDKFNKDVSAEVGEIKEKMAKLSL